jgi:ribonuclease P protein component
VLASASRLRSSTEIRDVIRHGRRASSDGLTVHLRPGDVTATATTGGCSRAAFVVPRKVGTSVTRNTVTRRLRHLLRDRLLTLTEGSALVVRVHPEAAQHSYAELGEHLDRCLQKANR